MKTRNANAGAFITGIGSISIFGANKGLVRPQKRPLSPVERWTVPEKRFARFVESFRPRDIVPGIKTRRFDRLSIWAVIASYLALEDAQIDPNDISGPGYGVVFGTGFGPLDSTEAFCRSVADYGHVKADAIVFPETLDNTAGSHVSRILDLKGPNITVTSRGISGETAIVQAASILESGEADLIIAVAGDVLTQSLFDFYESIGVLSSECFDGQSFQGKEANLRNRFIPGEGLAAFVMESGRHHRGRSARPYCRYKSGCLGGDLSALPFSWGQDSVKTADIINAALGSACPDEIGAIVSLSNGFAELDAVESDAIRKVFGSQNPPKVLFPGEYIGGFDGNAVLKMMIALSTLKQDAPDISENSINGIDHRILLPQGRLALSLGASTGGGRAALVFELL
jgi:3-oxoacyl-[acyl-carrier-protein] synthase II